MLVHCLLKVVIWSLVPCADAYLHGYGVCVTSATQNSTKVTNSGHSGGVRHRGIADETNTHYYGSTCVGEQQEQRHDPCEFQDSLIW